MNWALTLQLIVSVLVALCGWIIVHRLNGARDLVNKHRDLRLQYLIDAYRKLENGAGRDLTTCSAYAQGVEEAIADIQLFGTQSQIDVLTRFFAEKKERGESSLNNIINHLRDDLRRELDLPKLQGNVTWLRIEKRRGA